MYDTAAQANFINTYVPVNFDNLYRAATTQNQMIQQAAQDFGNQLKTFGQFTSPSDTDVQSWYNLTIGSKPIRSIIDEASVNPNLLKDPAFRARMVAATNSVDYQSLSRLQQSKQMMLNREEMNRQLAIRGQFNPEWHSVDYSNYDTLNQGIFSDTAPTPYKSIREMVEPYVNNLKPSFMGVSNGWVTKGVSADRTDNQVNTHWSDIMITPEYTMHKRALMNRGYSSEDADKALHAMSINAGREFSYQDSERDPWWMQQQSLKMKQELEIAKAKAKADATKQQQALNNFTTLVHNDGKAKYLELFGVDSNGESILDPEERRAYLAFGPSVLPASKQQALSEAMDPRKIAYTIGKTFRDYKTNRHSTVSETAFNLMRELGDDIGFQASDMLTASGASSKVADNVYNYASTANLQLLDNTFLSTFGSSYAAEYITTIGENMGEKKRKKLEKSIIDTRTKFEEDWNNGKFRDVTVEGLPYATRLTTIEPTTSYVSDQMYHTSITYIPVSELEKLGYTEEQTDQLKQEYGTVVRGDLRTSTTTRSYGDDTSDVATTNVNISSKQQEYLAVPTARAIQSQGLGATVNDQQYMIEQKIGTTNNFTQLGLSQLERQN